MDDPYGAAGYTYTGPGFRLPFYIISPWTRGENVYTEHADHSSQIMFLEKWLGSKGKPFTQSTINPWRRQNMADLTKAFDFDHPDYSIPSMPNASYPSTDSKGNWNGYSVCEQTYPEQRPPVPYGMQNEKAALQTEQGFKKMRGNPTEGRYLTFEMNGQALTNSHGRLTASRASSSHNSKAQRFVLHESDSQFSISSTVDNSTISGTSLKKGGNAATFTISDMGNGKGYTIESRGQYLSIDRKGRVTMSRSPAGFSVFSVSYDD